MYRIVMYNLFTALEVPNAESAGGKAARQLFSG